MNKNGQVKLGSTPCDLCPSSATIFIGGRMYCDKCAPSENEKRGSEDETFKNAHDRLAEIHLDKE